MTFFRKAQIVQKRKEQVIFLIATSRRQGDLLVYQITLKTYKMPQSYHSLKSKATITPYDLSPWLFCIDAISLCEFESDKIWVNEFE